MKESGFSKGVPTDKTSDATGMTFHKDFIKKSCPAGGTGFKKILLIRSASSFDGTTHRTGLFLGDFLSGYHFIHGNNGMLAGHFFRAV